VIVCRIVESRKSGVICPGEETTSTFTVPGKVIRETSKRGEAEFDKSISSKHL